MIYKKKPIMVAFTLSFILFFSLYLYSGSRSKPKYQVLKHELKLSLEGFRNVKWITPLKDVPWKFSKSHFPADGFWREDENYNVFGIKAKWITYTFRNSFFYGVRIDIEGKKNIEKAMESVRMAYPPEQDIKNIKETEYSWNTKYTQVWITLPKDSNDFGTIYLWGRDRRFPDKSIKPVFLIPPPRLNSYPEPYVPRYYVIYKAEDSIVIDGNFNERSWEKTKWFDSFVDHQFPYAPPPWKTTRAKMVYDENYIYVAAQLQEENVWGSITKRDSIIYYENDFEIFLDPTANGINYFEFEMNSLNTMFDMWHELDNHRGAYADPVFDCEGMRHVVKVNGTLNYHYDIDKGWNVEVKIPLNELKKWNPQMSVPIKRGDKWRINFDRVQYMHTYSELFPYLIPNNLFTEDWVLGPTDTGDLHIPELWPVIVFSNRYTGKYDVELENNKPVVYEIPTSNVKKEKGMVHFPACSIVIGPDPTDTIHSPAHKVDVPEFWMDKYEVTVAEFTEFLNKGGNDKYYNAWMQIPERCGIIKNKDGKYSVVKGRENYPVTYVSHDAAMAYAESIGKTLPTEEMWERAARGLEGRKYPWGNEDIDPSKANYNFYYGGTTPVGSFPKGATPEGIYDLAGNVKEWTNSKFMPYPGGRPFEHRWLPIWYDEIPDRTNPDIYWWVNRGGGWTKQESCMESAYRDGQGHMNVGFRCVKIIE